MNLKNYKNQSNAYQIIKKYYGSDKAKRSGIALINHIDEGLIILDYLGTNRFTKDAYCLHPMFQSNNDFNKNIFFDLKGVDYSSVILTIEYRNVANSYLSSSDIKNHLGFTNLYIKKLLIADKIQNYKDFMIYHKNSHDNADRLYNYFWNWFGLLGLSTYKVSVLCGKI